MSEGERDGVKKIFRCLLTICGQLTLMASLAGCERAAAVQMQAACTCSDRIQNLTDEAASDDRVGSFSQAAEIRMQAALDMNRCQLFKVHTRKTDFLLEQANEFNSAAIDAHLAKLPKLASDLLLQAQADVNHVKHAVKNSTVLDFETQAIASNLSGNWPSRDIQLLVFNRQYPTPLAKKCP